MTALRRGRVGDVPAIGQLWLESAKAGFAELRPADHAWPWAASAGAAERTAAAMEEGATVFVAEGPRVSLATWDSPAAATPTPRREWVRCGRCSSIPPRGGYEAHGFVPDGARRREAVWNEIDEVRYRRAL